MFAVTAGVLAQFSLLHWDAFYSLSLKSYLYDQALWVKRPPSVIIMGSSLARYGIVPQLIAKNNNLDVEQVVNLGADAGTPFEMYNSYMKRRSILSRAKVVYYTLEPWIFSTKYYRVKKYERIYLSLQQHIQLSGPVKGTFEYVFPYRHFKNNLILNKSDAINATMMAPWQGYYALEGQQHTIDYNKFIEDYEPYDMFPLSKLQFNYLIKLKQQVESDGALFVFVLVPMSNRWREYYKDSCMKYNDDFEVMFNDIVGPAPFIGNNDGTRYGLTDTDYFDIFHLNASGSIKFTQAVFNDISEHMKIKPVRLAATYSSVKQ